MRGGDELTDNLIRANRDLWPSERIAESSVLKTTTNKIRKLSKNILNISAFYEWISRQTNERRCMVLCRRIRKKKKVRERTAMGSLDFCIKSSIYSQC